jgi:hypothetical protein
MEKISFFEILKESWDTSFSRTSFLFFGFLIALPLAVQTIAFPDTSLMKTTFLTGIAEHPLLTLLIIGSFFIFKLFGKSNLIVILHQNTEKDKQAGMKRLSFREIFRNFKKALLLDLAIALFFFFLLFILALPSLMSFFSLGTIPETLLILSALILIPVIIISFFIREFSFFYFLLSPLRLKASFEAGSSLFTKKRNLCLAFGLFATLQTLLFTFFLNLAMLGIVALSQKMTPFLSETILIFIGTLFSLSWYEVWRQALWLNFFKRLAAPKNPTPEKTVDVLLEKVSEIPSA